jgi:hypothetical protein
VALLILQRSAELFEKTGNLPDVPIAPGGKITVCGDTHGQYFDLLNIFKINGLPSVDNPYGKLLRCRQARDDHPATATTSTTTTTTTTTTITTTTITTHTHTRARAHTHTRARARAYTHTHTTSTTNTNTNTTTTHIHCPVVTSVRFNAPISVFTVICAHIHRPLRCPTVFSMHQ